MKKKKVEQLRAWAQSGSYDPPDGDAVLEALDEREALLKALKRLSLFLDEDGHKKLAEEARPHLPVVPTRENTERWLTEQENVAKVAAAVAIKRAESKPTRYGELVERERVIRGGPFIPGETEQLYAEMDRVWSTMTTEERLAEEHLLDRHYRQLCADAAHGVGAFLQWCAT